VLGSQLRNVARDLLAPPRCPACRRGTSLPGAPSNLCARCLRLLTDARPRALMLSPRQGLEAIAAVPYVPPATGLVAALKSGRVPGVAGTMAELIAAALRLPLPQGTILAPVGAAPWRQLRRGLDPAAEVALALGALTDVDVAPSLLTRRGHAPQRGRGRQERLRSPPEFAAKPERIGASGSVLLIDDVVTTGGTLTSSAAALERAGIAVAGAACFAWTPPPVDDRGFPS
jgi:predicted amidophosphoribosyltransferase